MAAKCQILCDSTCDLSQTCMEQLSLTYVPFSYHDTSEIALSGPDDLFQSINAHDFYNAMRKGAHPMTSQPSQADFDTLFQKMYESKTPAVYFSLSSGISGAFEGAQLALARLQEAHPDEEIRIYIVDTRLASTALTLFIEAACKKRDEGLNAEQLVMWAEEARREVHVYFMVENLDALHRGGRIPKSVALIGSALDVKPILSINLEGKLEVVSVVRGRKKGMRKLLEYFEKEHAADAPYSACAIGDADVAEDAYELAGAVSSAVEELYRPSIGPTMGAHVGPGMLSICFWGADRSNMKPTGKVKGLKKVAK